jgi:hypothetical protein
MARHAWDQTSCLLEIGNTHSIGLCWCSSALVKMVVDDGRVCEGRWGKCMLCLPRNSNFEGWLFRGYFVLRNHFLGGGTPSYNRVAGEEEEEDTADMLLLMYHSNILDPSIYLLASQSLKPR